MNRVVIAATLALALTGTRLGAASGQATSPPDPKVGTRVTITGCLHQGTSDDSFVLLGVVERPADSPAPIQPVPWAIYWLDSTEGLKERVGDMVDITGKVTKRRSKPGTITVDIEQGNERSTAVEVAGGANTVTTEEYDDWPQPKGASTAASTIEVTRPVYKLAVESVHSVNIRGAGPACR